MLTFKIADIYNYIQNKLEEEYSYLSLWYFVSFISGIIIYFSLRDEPSLNCIIPLTLCSLLIFILARNNLFARFAVLRMIALMFGIASVIPHE